MKCVQYLRSILPVVLFCFLPSLVLAKTQVQNIVCEYRINPLGIDVIKPRLSWQLHSEEKDVKQIAYEIRVAETPAKLGRKNDLIWSTGKVNSEQSVNVAYEGPALESMERAYWQVRVWDNKNDVSKWSEPAYWEMGILETDAWSAAWITQKDEVKSDSSLPVQYYRTEFPARKKVTSARVYVTSLGIYQLFLNGKKVGDDLFTPGWTSYEKRLQYQSYDVTSLLQQDNALGAMVGDGWYRGNIGWKGDKAYYGDQLALLVQLVLSYADGTSETIDSDENWLTSYGPILESDHYNGEKYDARLEMEGWPTYGFDDSKWTNVGILEHPKDILVASNSVPVRAIKEITPLRIFTTPKGETVLDMGQNLVGWVRMKVEGQRGDEVILQFAEVLDKEGNFYMENLRAAKATDVYTLKGGGEEVFEPHFTFHGFRYVKLEGYPGDLTTEKISAVVIHSDMKPTGTFTCSDPLINQLQSNIQWGQRGNFLDIPTDCPQRDERAGWTGDAQVFSRTAAFNFDVAAFYTKWLRDLASDQLENGLVPHVVPDILSGAGGATVWGDAAIIVPWTVYQTYGDQRILEEQYPSMQGWLDYMTGQAGEDYLWNNPEEHHWGDWLSYHSDRHDYTGATTEKDLICTASFYYSAKLLGQMASIIGKTADALNYEELAKKIKQAFAAEFITPNGRLVSHTQTAFALALSFDLIPENLKEQTAAYFANDVKHFGHLTTGFVGTPLLCSTLSSIGRDDLAYMLLNRKEYPSWLYPVTAGATTIWERWDAQRVDGTIAKGMNSFNHYAYGAIGEWLYSHVAGIRMDVENPGYKHFFLEPHPGGGLTSASAEFSSIHGKIKSDWKIEGDQFIYEIEIPANTRATVILPDSYEGLKELGSGSYSFTIKAGSYMRSL